MARNAWGCRGDQGGGNGGSTDYSSDESDGGVRELVTAIVTLMVKRCLWLHPWNHIHVLSLIFLASLLQYPSYQLRIFE